MSCTNNPNDEANGIHLYKYLKILNGIFRDSLFSRFDNKEDNLSLKSLPVVKCSWQYKSRAPLKKHFIIKNSFEYKDYIT